MGYTYLGLNVAFLKMMGMFPLAGNTHLLYRTVYYLWRCLCFFCLFTHSLLCITDIFVRSTFELTDVSANILNAVIFMGGTVRLLYYYKNASGIESLTNRLNDFFKYTSEIGVYASDMSWYVDFARKVSVFWFWNVGLTGEFMALLPLFFSAGQRVLPIPAWYPWDRTVFPFYELSYFLQILTNFHMSFVYGNSDMLYVSYCILIGGQFDILGVNYKNCFYTALLEYGLSAEEVEKFSSCFNYYGSNKAMELEIDNKLYSVNNQRRKLSVFEQEISEIIDSDKFKQILDGVLKKCIRHHQMLLAYCDTVEAFFNPIILPSLSFAMFYVIFMLFTVATTSTGDKSLFIFYISYILCGMLQVFLINYFGQFLTTKSIEAGDAIYEMPWYLGSKSFTTTFKFVQMRFGKPIVLTAGKFFDIGLQTFIAIGRTSFSYFTVLRKVTGKDN